MPSDAARPQVSAMVENILGCKWSVRLLDLVAAGAVRPGAALRACPGLSAKVMNERWRKLVRYGIVRRTVSGSRPPIEVEYALTPFGCRFLSILDAVHDLQDAIDRNEIAVEPAPPATPPAPR